MALEVFKKNFEGFMRWIAQGHNPAALEQQLSVNDILAKYRKPSPDLTPWARQCRDYNRSQKCSHLKGGRARSNMNDYNVSFHTFITGEERIRCLNNCGFEVWNKPEWSFKWQYAAKMLKYTTNRPSASEQVRVGVEIQGRVIEYFPDIPGIEAKIKAKYPAWDGVIQRVRSKAESDGVIVSFFDSLEPMKNMDDMNPIKGRQPATPMPAEDSNDIIIL